jgi:hypothetical protein
LIGRNLRQIAPFAPDQAQDRGGMAKLPMMICCLFIAALLAPFGLKMSPVMGQSAAACCANRRMLFLAAAILVSVAAVCATFFIAPQAAPFHHICRLIGARG